jgi:hypothetical protein
MGHVLGLVSINGNCNNGCDPDNPFEQSSYQCAKANEQYSILNPGQDLLLENNGGRGTSCSHWEEDSFKTAESSELMTGFFEENLYQPLSLVTIAALDDIGGYTVDYCAADIWPATDETIKRFPIMRTEADHNTGVDTTTMTPSDIGNWFENAYNDVVEWVMNNLKIVIVILIAFVVLVSFLLRYCCCKRRKDNRVSPTNEHRHASATKSYADDAWEVNKDQYYDPYRQQQNYDYRIQI